MSTTPTSDQGGSGFSRRTFLQGTSGALAGATMSPLHAATVAAQPKAVPSAVPRTPIQVTINGTTHHIDVEDCWTLVELLRDHLGLTGTKIG